MSTEVGKIVYVDNGVFACTLQSLAGQSQRSAADCLARAGLPVHEITSESDELETLGLSLRHQSVRVKSSRIWRLRSAVKF
eukprot:5410840-Karenia_brevis.AAC.1